MLQATASTGPVPAPKVTALQPLRIVTATRTAASCSTCCLQGICLPCGLDARDLDHFGEMALTKRKVTRGAALYRSGGRFDAVHPVRSGAFKSVGVSRQGEEKITGFHLPGEVLGLDAIHCGQYGYDAIALEDSEVCVIPFARLEQMALAVPALQRQVFRALSSDISRDHGLMLLLGSMNAEQRLAAFLLSLSRRYQRLGFAATSFMLRMTREEIGSYLGLTLETVSRVLSRLQREGLIAIRGRDIELKKVSGLMEIVGR
jgi:CRP/FNR family transcriptional regulator, anaerobic regulatory protein